MTASLVTLDYPSGPAGAVRAGGFDVPLAAAGEALGVPLPAQVFDVITRWDELDAAVHEVATALTAGRLRSVARPVGAFGALTPLRYPRKLVCAGANYPRHLAEMGVSYERKAGERPFFFLKPPSTTLVGPGATSPMPEGCENLDWEIELAVVIGRRARHISAADALDVVAGYAVAVDLSARDLLMRPDTIFKFDFLAGKAQDGSCPLGPELVPARYVPDPQALTMRLSVNGQVKQDATTEDMIFSIAEQIAGASDYVTLEPGDVILTGTPHGVGFPRGDRLRVGDEVRAEIDGLGALVFTITEPAGAVSA